MNNILCSGSRPNDRDALWRPCAAGTGSFLPQGVLQVICKNLQGIKDLSTARLISRDFRDAASMELKAVDAPLGALCQHRGGSSLAKAFPRLHTLSLSLKNVHKADASSLVNCVASLATLLASSFGTSLQHLVLRDFPVHDIAHPHGSRWKLQPLQRLTGLKSLELRLVACLPCGSSASDVQSAQASLLETLAPLQHLTSLTLRLLDLQAFPLHTQGHPGTQDDPGEEEEASEEGEGGEADPISPQFNGNQCSFDSSSDSSGQYSGNSTAPPLVEDEPDVDVDLEEAQHTSHEAPDVASLLPLAQSLRVLRLEQCVMRHRTLDQLCRSFMNLEDLTLSGSLGLSHSAIRTLGGLSGLQSMSLGSVQLIFEEDEDCPESVMSALYGCLEGLPHFEFLSFTLATLNNTRWLHTAYTLGLYEHTGLACTLRSLELNTVVFDCDYSLLIFAELTALTSLRISYQTWPLSLGQEDLKLLAPLRNLRELKLLAHAQEQHQLLALTNGVLETWRSSFEHLTCLHFSGVILFESDCAPELAHFSYLRNLSLTAVADYAQQLEETNHFLSQNDGPMVINLRTHVSEERSNAAKRAVLERVNGDGDDGHGGDSRRRESFRHRAAKGALYLGWSLGPLGLPDLHVPSSIPPTLFKLALSGFALCMRDYSYIASLPELSHLKLRHPGLRPEQLLLTNTSNLARNLETLVLKSPGAPFESMQRHFDRRPAVPPWRLWCHHRSSERSDSCSSANSTASYASSTSAGESGSRPELTAEDLLDQAPWWERHEASLINLTHAQLGQLQALRHLKICVPSHLSNKTTSELLGLLSTQIQCPWSRESVVAALGDRARQLRSLHVWPLF